MLNEKLASFQIYAQLVICCAGLCVDIDSVCVHMLLFAKVSIGN